MKSLATFTLLACLAVIVSCYDFDPSPHGRDFGRQLRPAGKFVSSGSRGFFRGDDRRGGFKTGGRAFSSGGGKVFGVHDKVHGSDNFFGNRRFRGDFDEDDFHRRGGKVFGSSFGRRGNRGGFKSDGRNDKTVFIGKPHPDVHIVKPKTVPGPVHGSGHCPHGVKYHTCYAEPCSTARCSKYPRARCENNYCGGCFARWIVDWYGNEKDVTEYCH